MIKHWKFALKVVCFMAIIGILVLTANYILTPKKYYDNTWPTTTTYKGFYQMQENSIDVLFFGSSHAASCFNPQEVYNNYGIRSYNLGCEQQNVMVSYYWLKEALRYQSPKIVVLDTYMLFEYHRYDALNTAESCTRMAMDAMKLSGVKLSAIKDICENDESQSFNSYIFKNIRFHTRWTSLTEQDFSFKNIETHYELKGYAPLSTRYNNTSYAPYSEYNTDDTAEMVPLMQEYLDKMVDLCADNNIKLVLVKTPTTAWSISKHNTIIKYAEDNGIYFWDFNDKGIYDACGFVFSEDMHDNGHGNIWGAKKISIYLASQFYELFGIGSGDYYEQWLNTKGYYERVYEDCELHNITDINEYINNLQKSRYTVLITSKYDTSYFITGDLTDKFRELGLDFSINKYESYYAVISGGEVVAEKHSPNSLTYYGSTRNNKTDYVITSTNYNTGDSCSVKINNTEQSKNQNGINIVVYSNETMKVVDSIYYNGSIGR
jgi:hypothetical protein